jgi:hypothetical protein
MVSLPSHHHAQDHGHAHGHHHDPALPHPAQTAIWSILRMPVVSRLAVTAGVCVALWAVVLLSMR